MTMPPQDTPIGYLPEPRQSGPHSLPRSVLRTLAALALTPLSLAGAAILGGKGVGMHIKLNIAVLRMIFTRAPIALRHAYALLLFPMFSTRYFEFDFAYKRLSGKVRRKYLDISSPRLLPLMVARENPGLKTVDLINPDKSDLEETARFAKAFGLLPKCSLHATTIQEFAGQAYDVVTCISVLEHIPEVNDSVRRIWDLLEPGGTLILTVPCAATQKAEYIKGDPYGLHSASANGYVFFQYLFDESMLQELIFPVTGKPAHMEIYGEKRAGYLRRILLESYPGSNYAFWFESIRMALNCRRFNTVRELVGEGVVCMEFVK